MDQYASCPHCGESILLNDEYMDLKAPVMCPICWGYSSAKNSESGEYHLLKHKTEIRSKPWVLRKNTTR